MQSLDKSFAAAAAIVSTIGFEGEGELRRFRRQSVADVLARYISQTIGQPATLLDVAVADGVEGEGRKRLIPSAIKALKQLPPARLVASGDRLTLRSDDLFEALLEATKEVHWPEAILSAQRDAIGGSRGALVRFARTDGGEDIEVFTTRPDTLFGASFIAVSPSHRAALAAEPARLEAFRAECKKVADDPNMKVGVPLGISVRHPFVSEHIIPVWLGNFVVDSYGTGAAGGCPAGDQRDLDFARRYSLPILSIICPPGMDPATFQVGASAHSGDGTIINSGFLNGLSVADAIDAAIARLVELGCGKPTVQYRLGPFVVADAAPASESDVCHLDRCWRFTGPFLTAAAVVIPTTETTWRPHAVHVTAVGTATRHFLDARILWRALWEGRDVADQEPWEEVVLIGDVVGPSREDASEAPIWRRDAIRLALLADTPPDRELEWSDSRYVAALKFVKGAHGVFGSEQRAGAVDKVSLARKVAKASSTLESALRRRRTNTAIAALREIVGAALESAEAEGLDDSARAFVASLLYSLLPDLAAKALVATGLPPSSPPAWPSIAEQSDDAEVVELIVQINGKKRGAVRVARNADEEMAIAAIRADGVLNAHLGERPIRKTVVVQNRLINLVI